jgi:hypothetical protein
MAFVALAWRYLRPGRWSAHGALAGLLSLCLAAGAYVALVGAVSLSAYRRFALLLLQTGAIGAAFGLVLVTASWLISRRWGAAAARSFQFAAVLGASPLASAMFVQHGVFADRLSVAPAWSVALPPLAHAGFGATALVLLVALVTQTVPASVRARELD